jgi:hypothetical protein
LFHFDSLCALRKGEIGGYVYDLVDGATLPRKPAVLRSNVSHLALSSSFSQNGSLPDAVEPSRNRVARRAQ